MTVFYRMCGIPSTNPSPIFQEDKFNLNQLCLKSFLLALKGVDIKVVYLLDHCDARYKLWIQSIDSQATEIIETNIGINATMLKSYKLALESKEELVLFQECDYLYRPDTGKDFKQAIEGLGLVSPYDHPDFYTRPDIHSPEAYFALVNGHHYRSATRNTMTFGMTRDALVSNYIILNKWGYLDNEVWHEMRANGFPLWTPLPSFATHMVKDYLAPGVDWKDLWETLT